MTITNRGKDFFIEAFREEHESCNSERREYVEKLMTFNRKLGEIEMKHLQIEAPGPNSSISRSDNVEPV